ncbi:MAG: hypothetical protein ACHQYQ_07395 [Bacteriovoracales bacterium]
MDDFEAIYWFLSLHLQRLFLLNKKTSIKYKNKFQLVKTPKDLSDFLQSTKIPKMSQRAQLTLLKWLDGEWPIVLTNKIPTPSEMLSIQAKGKRFVSWLPHLNGPILEKKDNWDFMLHDLMHAERFFHLPELYRAQKGFFQWLLDQSFQLTGFEWDYLRSDMNTHPLHALQFLKHLLNCQNLKYSFDIPFWEIINSPEMSDYKTQEINHFFQNYKSKF